MNTDPAPDRYDLSFSVSGPGLDLGALLAAQGRPRNVDAWRAGDVRGAGRRATTNGLTVPLGRFATHDELVHAIETLLATAGEFLRESAKGQAQLSCAMWIHAVAPSTVTLPPELLERLARARIGWSVTAYPVQDEADG